MYLVQVMPVAMLFAIVVDLLGFGVFNTRPVWRITFVLGAIGIPVFLSFVRPRLNLNPYIVLIYDLLPALEEPDEMQRQRDDEAALHLYRRGS
jgi:hypothetical protein